MTSSGQFHPSLLRPPIIHVLRAAGFTATRPSVLDTLTDLTSRYLTILSAHTARHARLRSESGADPLFDGTDAVTVTDVRMAMQDAGALFPQMSEMEEQIQGEEDMRGMEAFLAWTTGDVNKEIRRIAGLVPEEAGTIDLTNPNPAAKAEDVALEAPKEDFLGQLKRKHAKTEEGMESRYQGTLLGKDMGEREIKIEGWDLETLHGWAEMMRQKYHPQVEVPEVMEVGSGYSSPLSSVGTI
ncbi:hypothetical protein P7C71_g4668, partial [Lecanoromycetidae sp. Uapishka_2]